MKKESSSAWRPWSSLLIEEAGDQFAQIMGDNFADQLVEWGDNLPEVPVVSLPVCTIA